MGVVQPEIKPQQGKCYMLAYNQGFANLSSVHYLAVKNTANKGACCNLCLRDSRCVAWTRVAGGTRSPPMHLCRHGVELAYSQAVHEHCHCCSACEKQRHCFLHVKCAM